MIIQLHIPDSDLNRIAGSMAKNLIKEEVKRTPAFFVALARKIEVIKERK